MVDTEVTAATVPYLMMLKEQDKDTEAMEATVLDIAVDFLLE